MSFIEDNDLSMEGYDDYIESCWKDGIHTDGNGVEHKISEMSDFHLQNTINFFKTLDTTPLQHELKNRRLGIKTIQKKEETTEEMFYYKD